MAIPTWTWSEGNAAEATGAARAGIDGTDVSSVSHEFELLASPVRLEVLLALAESDGPLRYTALRAATSIEDNGKLNYHLRKLESYVSSDEAGYELTPRGRRLVGRIS